MLQDSLHKFFLAGITIWRKSGTINPKERPRWGVLSVALYQGFDR
jgi:hypothetical protein